MLHFAASSGVSVNETNSEKSVAVTTTAAYSFRYSPTMPGNSAIGANTTTSTIVIATAAPPISLRPLIAAFTGSCPRSRCLVMFSNTTIESSTRIPMIRARPIIDMSSM